MYQPTNNYGFYPQIQTQQTLKGRPVASLDEVRATSIDFDGSVFYFPDLANKKIYTKQINVDGTSTLNMYELQPIPEPVPQNSVVLNENYITREEFEKALEQIKNNLSVIKPQTTNTIQQSASDNNSTSVNNSSYGF